MEQPGTSGTESAPGTEDGNGNRLRRAYSRPVGALRWFAGGLALTLLSVGVWISSSMAAFAGAPRGWVLASAALGFPILPGLWAWLAARGRGRPPRLGWLGDLAARAAILNLAFIVGLLALRPQLAFVAVSTRGDWFLDGARSSWAPAARSMLLEAAEGLAVVYRAAVGNRYAEAAPRDDVPPPEHPVAGQVAVAGPAVVGGRSGGRLAEQDSGRAEASAASAKRALGVQPSEVAAEPEPAVGGAGPGRRPPDPASPPPVERPAAARPASSSGDGDASRMERAPEASATMRAGKASGRTPPGSSAADDGRPAAAEDGEALVLSNRDGALGWRRGPAPEAGLSVVEDRDLPPRPPPLAAPADVDRAPVAPASGGALSWPLPGGPHPEARAAPEPSTRSVAALAEYIRGRAATPLERLRVLHDWMATHIAYEDAAGLDAPPDPDPAEVLRTRKAVCSGFARLFRDAARALGVEAAFVVGRTRAPEGDLAPTGHAWNAVKLDGAWYLVDVTWDVTRWTSGKTQPYSTHYFLAPPEVFRVTHLPEQAAWQLTDSPLGLAAFLRQPMCKPTFFANGLRLLAPRRPQVTTRGEVSVQIDNPRARHLTLTLDAQAPSDEDPRYRPCAESAAEQQAQLTCRVPRSGEHTLALWAGSGPRGTRTMVARWQVRAE